MTSAMDGSRSSVAAIPAWALDQLACPDCHNPLRLADGSFVCEPCGVVGRWEQGIARFSVREDDPPIALYRSLQGPNLHKRAQIPFTTSSLDAPVYESYMQELRPASRDAVIVDAGAGDGRNAEAWLGWGYQRVIATDAVLAPLLQFRARLEESHPEWLDRLLLVEADIRRLPLADALCDIVLAVEVLCLLQREYESGVEECVRVLRQDGRLLVSDYASEGALLTRLLYGGVSGLLDVARQGTLPLQSDPRTRLRLLTERQMAEILDGAGLSVVWKRGLSGLAPLLGFLRGEGRLSPQDEQHWSEVVELMNRVGRTGQMRRTHVMLAEKLSAKAHIRERAA